MGAQRSPVVVGTYLLVLVLVIVLVRTTLSGRALWGLYVLVAVSLVPLAQYLSVRYSIDASSVRAWSILGRWSVALNEIETIEPASLHDLVAVGGALASWVHRGRMYSPVIGEFVPISTNAASGLLVSGGEFPFYISPRDLPGFARELSHRARARGAALLKDAGGPDP